MMPRGRSTGSGTGPWRPCTPNAVGSEASPTVLLKIDSAIAGEAYALPPQKHALETVPARRPPADLAFGVHDPVPGDIVRGGPEGPAHRARAPGHAKRAGDRSVTRDPAAGDPADERVDAGKEPGPPSILFKHVRRAGGNAWWSWRELNPRPPLRQRGALPLSYSPTRSCDVEYYSTMKPRPQRSTIAASPHKRSRL
jgi:hypothetical protein